MRDVLAQAGRLAAPSGLRGLYARGGDDFFVDGRCAGSLQHGFLRLYVRRLLGVCLIQVEAAEQVRWLNAWKAMLERSILQPSGALKIDGSAYHHGGHYHSLCPGRLRNYPRVLQELHGTPWRLSAGSP